MNLENIPEQSKEVMNQVTNAVEKTGKKIANKLSKIADGKAEEVAEETIQATVDRAIDILQIASKRVQEKDINGERVTLEVDVSMVDLAHLKITTDVPGKNEINER